MKSLFSFLNLNLWGVILSVVIAANMPQLASAESTVDVLEVEFNENASIDNGYYQGTLIDGSILCFNLSGSSAYFCGAVSTASTLSVPEKVSCDGTEYIVEYCGFNHFYDDMKTLVFDEATSVTSLTLPSTITSIINYIPSTITDLHLSSEIPPSMSIYMYSSTNFIKSATVWVPQSVYDTYQSKTLDNSSAWYGVEVHYEGWEPKKITINETTPGTFGNLLLKEVEQWTDVEELTVIGHMNADDMKLLTRLKQMIKLDLSQTDISFITGCSGISLLKTVLLPSTVTEVDANTFKGCSKLQKISIPNATSIGNYAFSGCSSLTEINLPTATTIGHYAFDNCRDLVSVSLPAATSIGNNAFYYCSNLVSVSLLAATSIEYQSFFYCSNLESVSLPAATSIGFQSFCYCSNLESVSMPVATSIGNQAFYLCSKLNEIVLSDCMQSIGDNAFSGCQNLKDVYCYVIAPFVTSGFNNIGGYATLHVPAFSITSYMLCDGWYSFYKIVPIDESIDKLTVDNSFTITSLTGLAEKIELNLTKFAHLTVSTENTFKIGTYNQEQATKNGSYWDSNSQQSIYAGISSLVTNSKMEADTVNLHLQLETNRWHFISFPFDVNVSDIEYSEGTLWVIRKYSGADRAALTGNTWQNMTNGMTLKAGEGYILHCANESTSTVEFVFHAVNNSNKNNIFAYNDVVKPLATYASEYAHNRSWNLVGNPYPSYYDTQAIEHNGVITVYQGSYDSWSGSGSGSYTAYSLIDDNYQLRPNEAFFVQCPPDANSMTFKAEGRTHEYRSNSDGNVNTRIKSHKLNSSVNSNRKVYNFTLSNSDFTDRARLVINPNAKMDYEINCDASKFMSDNAEVPQFYVLDNGIRYAIDERPIGDGIITLGARFGETGEYTIALKDNPSTDENIILTDNETGLQTNIAEDTYTFTAKAGTSESRFTLSFDSDVTGVDEIVNNNSSDSKTLYDLQGREATAAPQKGVYIIKQNGKSYKAVK